MIFFQRLWPSFWLLLITLASFVLSLPNEIYLGGLFETGDEALELAFKYAIERVNADPKILPYTRLIPKVERLEKSDSFQVSRKVCALAAMGVAAIFGPQSTESSNHVQSTCDALQIPHMQIRWDFRLEATNQSVNLYPHPLMLGRGLRDLVKTKNWKNFAILYEDNDALIRIQEVLKDPELREKRIVIRQFVGEDYRKVFKEVGKMQIKNLILDVHRDRIHTALRHAQQVEELSEYHNYLFTSLDLQTVDMQDYQYAGTNISSYCLMDESSSAFLSVINDWQLNSLKGFSNLAAVTGNSAANSARWNMININNGFTSSRIWPLNFSTEVALMFDSVQLLATALNDLQRTQEITIKPLSCEKEETWQFGSTLTNYMRMISSVKGITGEIKFDDNGLRTDMKLRLLEIHRDGLKQVGDWTTQKGVKFMSNYTKRMQEEFRATLKNKTLTIVTTFSRPYTMRVDDYETKSGNDIYEGFSIDLIKAISEILNFKYNIKIVDDGTYGAKKENGEWGGMVRELIDGKADIAVADLTITYERESAVDFTMPFMNLGIGILYRKPKKEPPKLFSFMSPLAIEVWIYLLTAFLGVTLCLFVIARFSPYEWINPHPCVRDPDELENNFTMKNTLWFTIGCLMQQGCDIMPRALSTRVLAASWWFFILILVSSYTANLAAFLTVERMVNPIESVEDLAKQQKIPYGCQDSGSTQAFFKDSNFSTYSRMWSFMESARPSVFVESNDKGVERVKKGDYAFLMESTSIEYIVERECDLYQVGGLLDSKGYGIATPPESPYRGIISDAILELQELGTLQELKNVWWSIKKGGGQCGPKDGAQKAAGAASELGLANVGGVFVVLAGGSVIAIVICVSEFIWKMKQIPRAERDNIFIELMRELKHVICCYGSTRPVRRNVDDVGSQTNSIPPFMPLPGFGFTPQIDLAAQMGTLRRDKFS